MADWSPAQVIELKHRRASGLTASQIGRAMGFTRNAILGKLYRLSEPPSARNRVMGQYRAVDVVERKRIILEVQAGGGTVRDAALRLGLRIDSTHDTAKRLGCPFPRLTRAPKITASKPRKSVKGVRQPGWSPPVVDEIAVYEALRRADGAMRFVDAPFVGRCKWFLDGEHGVHGLTCAAKITPGATYCSNHYAVSRVPVPVRRRFVQAAE